MAALAALDRAGYGTVVVSNLPLSAPDRARVAAACRHLIERPNFGYDFGAYRDGLRHVAKELPHAARLVLMNDSAWFPVPGSHDWLAEAEAQGADLVGAVWNHGLPPVDLGDWQSYRWAPDPDAPGHHYCSFALSLGPAVLRAPAFHAFWQHLWLTDDKIRTVQNGEVGLSRALINAGHSHGCTLDISGLDRDLAAMTLDELTAFVRSLVIPQDPAHEAFRDRILADSAAVPAAEGHAMLRQAALVIVALTGPAYAMPRFLLERHGYAFLKKSPLRLSRSGALETLAVAQKLPGEAGKTIHMEARAMLR
jgi:lipopolysaccharide biosynthesis protein